VFAKLYFVELMKPGSEPSGSLEANESFQISLQIKQIGEQRDYRALSQFTFTFTFTSNSRCDAESK